MGTLKTLSDKIKFRKNAVLIFLIVVICITGILQPVFFSPRNIVNVLGQVSVIGILALGTTLLMVTGLIDLSIGMALSFVAVVVASVIKAFPEMSIVVPIAIGLVLGLGTGLLNGVIVANTKAQPFVITLGMMSVYQGFALLVTGGYNITNLGPAYEWLGTAKFLGIGINTHIFILLFLLFFYLLRYRKMGRFSYAIGGSEATAYLAGISVKRQKIINYMINGLMVGAAAILFSARIGSALPVMGSGYELQTIAAVVVGGTSLAGGRGSIVGSLLGVLLLGVISNSLNLLRVGNYFQFIILGSIIVLAVVTYRHDEK